MLFRSICLLYAISLLSHNVVRSSDLPQVRSAVRTQSLGFMLLMVLAVMELFTSLFNNQYLFVLPLVLLLEEFLIASSIG